MKHWKYFKYIVRHRWFVFIEACKLGIPWRGLVHDLSKFLPSEWFPYANYFYSEKSKKGLGKSGYCKPDDTEDQDFDKAWLLHQHRNRHHWQFWILSEDSGVTKTLEMPLVYRKEMLADWRGAGKAQRMPDTKAWYLENKYKIKIGKDTRRWIETQLGL